MKTNEEIELAEAKRLLLLIFLAGLILASAGILLALLTLPSL